MPDIIGQLTEKRESLAEEIETLRATLAEKESILEGLDFAIGVVNAGATPTAGNLFAVDRPGPRARTRTNPADIARPGDMRPILTLYNGGRGKIGDVLWDAVASFKDGQLLDVNDLDKRLPYQINPNTMISFIGKLAKAGILEEVYPARKVPGRAAHARYRLTGAKADRAAFLKSEAESRARTAS